MAGDTSQLPGLVILGESDKKAILAPMVAEQRSAFPLSGLNAVSFIPRGAKKWAAA